MAMYLSRLEILDNQQVTLIIMYNNPDYCSTIDDALPYHVVHRIGSYPDVHGVFNAIMDWCFQRERNIRIDTHRANGIMQHCILNYGFQYCGIIYLESGDERLAYQKIL